MLKFIRNPEHKDANDGITSEADILLKLSYRKMSKIKYLKKSKRLEMIKEFAVTFADVIKDVLVHGNSVVLDRSKNAYEKKRTVNSLYNSVIDSIENVIKIED